MINLSPLFKDNEIAIIEKCIEGGAYDNIPSALDSHCIFEMTPAKETLLDEYVAEHRPVVLSEDSEVRKEMLEAEMDRTRTGEKLIETPEQEAEWQAKLDAERASKEANIKGGKVEEEAKTSTEDSIPEDDLSEVELTKNEIMETLKSKGIPFKPAQSKAELSDLLALS